MAACKDCIHERVCFALIKSGLPYLDDDLPAEAFCLTFKDKSRFIELPCNVGDKLFILYDDDYGEYECSEFCIGTLQELRVFAKCGISGYQNIQECPEYYCGQSFCSTSFSRQDFGKTVFLTRESAEKALKEREQK